MAEFGSSSAISFDSVLILNYSGTTKSSDILFTQVALGEGPIYRINPNGPQDIEIDNKYIDDLVDFLTNNTRPEVFGVKYSTGTVNPEGMSSFIPYKVVPIRFSSPIVLKSGLSTNPNIPAPPPNSVLFMRTNTNLEIDAIDSIKFKFNISSLQFQAESGILPTKLSVVAIVHDVNQTSDINQYIAWGGADISTIVDGGMTFDIEVKIPENKKSTAGYRVSVLKLTQDVDREGFTAEVEFLGIDELRHVQHNYPLTAVAGYAIKSSEFRSGQIPNYTSLIKGLIVDVPSNYNQPILPNGEVDWRQVEVPSTGPDSAAVRGYRTQKYQKVVQYSSNINIYDGLWDGTYKKDWTENPVWIIKFLLTDTRLGMGLPESIIDKFNFYTIARYCDAIDFSTGNFIGVPGFADGTFRFKPNNYATEIEFALLGLPEGTPIVERRFTCGITISDNTKALDLIQALCAGIRATLVFKGNKLSFVIDREGLYPEALFNETNIEQGSFSISGINEEDLITGIEVSFINFANHFKRETLVLDSDSPDITRENRLSIDAIGCTKKSQALRLAKYILDNNRSKRRKIRFNTNSYGSDLYPGSIIAVSQRNNNLTYGYGGVVYSNATPGSSTITLEHITSPVITQNFFYSNTAPIVLKIYQQESGKISHYIISNENFDIRASNNNVFGTDLIDVQILSKYDHNLNSFVPSVDNWFLGSGTWNEDGIWIDDRSWDAPYSSNTINASKYDLWALGYINPSDLYSASSDKLFRIDTITVDMNGLTSITATEYNSNALAAIDNAASSLVSIEPTNTSFKAPPPPYLGLNAIPAKTNEGVISYNLLVNTDTNTINYNIPMTTSVQYTLLPNILEVTSVE